MVQKALDKKQKGVVFFLQTEDEPQQTMLDPRGRTVKCAGTFTILGKTISDYVYAISRGHAGPSVWMLAQAPILIQTWTKAIRMPLSM